MAKDRLDMLIQGSFEKESVDTRKLSQKWLEAYTTRGWFLT